MLAPSARGTKKGTPPTLGNARTGELTPPGMCCCARANRSDEPVDIGVLEYWSIGVLESWFKPITPALDYSAGAMRSHLPDVPGYSALAKFPRRGSQVVRLRSAKPLFAGSIPAPAFTRRSALMDNEAFAPHAGLIDFVRPRRLHRRAASSMSIGFRRLHSRDH